MTVAELIEELKDLPQELPVKTEGCDCYGPCSGATLEDDTWNNVRRRYVILQRDDDIELDTTAETEE